MTNIQNKEYVSLENNKFLSTSSPEECCMTCYYMEECKAWQYHSRFKMCTQLMGRISPNVTPNSNFVSALKPTFTT